MARIVKRPEERRSEIVAAARRLFAANGVDNTAMSDIMRELTIAKGTIYHYFSSKDDLLEAVVENIVSTATERMRQIVADPTTTALEKIGGLVALGNVADENQQILEQLHNSANSGMHTRLLAVALQQQAPLYAEVFRQGTAEGTFAVDAPLETAEFVLAAIQFLTDDGIFPWSPETLIRRAQALPSLIEKQLGAPSGSFSFLNPSS